MVGIIVIQFSTILLIGVLLSGLESHIFQSTR